MSISKGIVLAAAAVIATAGSASAASTTRTYSFGPTPTDCSARPFVAPAFSSLVVPAGATLTGVVVTLLASYTTSGTATNTSTSPQTEKVAISGDVTIASTNAAINGVNVAVPPVTFTNAQPGVVNTFEPTTKSNTTSVTLAPGAFTTMPTTSSASTLTNQAVAGGGGNFANTFTTTASGQITFTYDYSVPSTVPEPASTMLVGAGLAGLGLLRRRK